MKQNIGIVCLLACLCTFSARGQISGDTAKQLERYAWIQECLVAFEKAQQGMTRSEIEALFERDGGFNGFYEVRYINPYCAFFKIDIAYDTTFTTNSNGRRIAGSNDVVTNISRPYLEYPASD